MGSHLEVEIKLPVDEPEAMAARIEASGARLLAARQFEDNRVLDFPDGRLRQRQVMLRLRVQGRGGLLTVKEKIDNRDEGVYKVRREYESRLEDAAAVMAALQAAGLRTLYRYQKYRRTYTHDGLLVTLDELPLGFFLELEGDPAAIDAWAARLGYRRQDYIRESYRTLHLRRHAQQGGQGEPESLLFAAEDRE